MRRLEGKGFCVQSVQDLVRHYDILAKGSRSLEDRDFGKGSGSSERVGNGNLHEGGLY